MTLPALVQNTEEKGIESDAAELKMMLVMVYAGRIWRCILHQSSDAITVDRAIEAATPPYRRG